MTATPRRFTARLAPPLLVATLTALVLLPSAPAGAIDCEAVRCSLQFQFDSQCPCSSFTSHSAYVDCIHNVIVASGFAKECNSAILNCMANSICGQGATAVTCTEKNGKCDVQQSAAQCTGAGGTVGSSTNCFPSCPLIQCCVESSPMGPFDTCVVETEAQCAAQGGIDHGSGTCSPNPCLIQCCVQSSPMGPFDTCIVEAAAQCAAQGGIGQGSGTCSPNPCLPGCFQPGLECAGCGTCPGGGLCAAAQSNTCGIHHFPNNVC